MKHTILLLAIALMVGCKKDPKDRMIEIVGLNHSSELTISYENESGTKYSSSEGLSKGKTRILIAKGGISYNVGVISQSDSFSCKAVVDGKTVYHHNGKEHHLKF